LSQTCCCDFTSLYDRSGNTEYYARVTPVLSTSATSTFQRSYYDGLDKLAVAEKFSSDSTSPDGGFEEYRYDALGRRVLRRWRGYWACANPCYNLIERTVWDGNQILVELRQDGSDLLLPAQWETDRGGAGGLAQRYYGAVAYTQGGGIDQPLDLIRYDYETPWGSPIAIIPHNNWRGEPDLGSYANGTARSLMTLPNGTRDSLRVDWPSKTALATHKLLGTFGYRGWFGSLVTEQRDGSGQMYMRNRYYDPATGRFTQEDPIGLAGGLNAYGFAAGDPINYADPFGLCPDGLSPTKAYVCNLVDAIFTGAGVLLGALGGGGGGAVAALPTGELAAPVTVTLGAAEGAGLGGVAGPAVGAAVTNVLFSQKASPGASAGEEREPTAGEIIAKQKRGSINREFPEQFRSKTAGEIDKLAKTGDKYARKAWKLLRDKRFDKQ